MAKLNISAEVLKRAKKGTLKNMSTFDIVCSLLIYKPQSEEGKGRFDARKFDQVIKESIPSTSSDNLENVLSILRMGHTIYQASDEMHTELYYIRSAACDAMTKDLEKRLGASHLANFKSIAKEIWKIYDSLDV